MAGKIRLHSVVEVLRLLVNCWLYPLGVRQAIYSKDRSWNANARYKEQCAAKW